MKNTFVITALLAYATATSCPQSPSGYRVDSLPYWMGDVSSSSTEMPCMYAANMSSSDTYKNFFFYWLFPNVSLTNSPLIMYMNGGPASTSMNALFTENGPLKVNQLDPDNQDSYQIWYDANNSW